MPTTKPIVTGAKTARGAPWGNAADVVQCQGKKANGLQCGVTNMTQAASADPLRGGERFCTFHTSQQQSGTTVAGGVQCMGQTSKGVRCGMTSALDAKAAEPLRNGEQYCTFHKSQASGPVGVAEGKTPADKIADELGGVVQCLGKTGKGLRCRLTNLTQSDAADALRKGSQFCAHHNPDKSESVATADVGGEGEDGGGVVACLGTTAKGTRCGITSVSQVKAADPLRLGTSKFCTFHKKQEVAAAK